MVLHPSVDRRFAFALEAPIRITETAGGVADWNFARIQFFKGGAQIERFELGSDTIRSLGFGRITARSNQLYTVFFRNNSSDFDDIQITLGFADINTGQQFTVLVPLRTFSGVNISLVPANGPFDGQ